MIVKDRVIKCLVELELQLPEENKNDFDIPSKAVSNFQDVLDESPLAHEGIGATVLDFKILSDREQEEEIN